MKQFLSVLQASPFFQGMTDKEILSVLHCIEGKVVHKMEGQYVMMAGDVTSVMGLVLSGSVLIIQEDLWGHRNILSHCDAGDYFAEPYAALPGKLLNVSVCANEACDILFLNVSRLLTHCASPCAHHSRLIRNMITVMARKTLALNDKVTHVSKRTTREKLLSYLSTEALRQKTLEFDIPFDRQQLADYLCVERAAMSAELSKLQKEGILETRKNHFKLKKTEG